MHVWIQVYELKFFGSVLIQFLNLKKIKNRNFDKIKIKGKITLRGNIISLKWKNKILKLHLPHIIFEKGNSIRLNIRQ